MLAVLLATHATYCKAGDKQECFDKRYTSAIILNSLIYIWSYLYQLGRLSPTGEKMVKIWSVLVVVVAAVVKVVMVAARTEVVIFSPLTGFPQQF